MTKLFLSLHVLAVIIAIGPVTVAASMFPAALRRTENDPDVANTVHVLHRICRVYAAVGFAVPVFGFATASSLGVLGSAWLVASIILTGAAAAILAFAILPGQAREIDVLHHDGDGLGIRAASRLAMYTGIFNLLWATVTVLMIVRPGSTTGA